MLDGSPLPLPFPMVRVYSLTFILFFILLHLRLLLVIAQQPEPQQIPHSQAILMYAYYKKSFFSCSLITRIDR